MRTIHLCLFVAFAGFLPSMSCANDLGTYGETFPVVETDLLASLAAKLRAAAANGRIEQMNRDFADRTRTSIENPVPIAGLTHTTRARTWLFDPSVTSSQDLADATGRVFIRAGDRINPLERLPTYNKVLIFVDGQDAVQVRFALSQVKAKGAERTFIILTSGAPLVLARRANVAFYFDQQGILVRRFGITQVPATVERAGDLLRISEVTP